MTANTQNRGRALVVLGGTTIALCLLLAGRRSGQGGKGDGSSSAGHGGKGDGRSSAGIGASSAPAPQEVEVWLRSGDRLELDGISSDLETMLARARVVGRARVHATGDARVGWIGKVINALRAQHVSVFADDRMFREADLVQALAGLRSTSAPGSIQDVRNAGARRAGSLPRYDERKGLWRGGDSRTLYAFTSVRTRRTWVVPGGTEMYWGPEATVRVATRAEAEELWQRPLHPGWQFATEEPRRNAAGEPSHIAILRRVADEEFAALQRAVVVSTSSSIKGAMSSAPTTGDVVVRGEYTSDGTHWGLGRGRVVAQRENGRWILG